MADKLIDDARVGTAVANNQILADWWNALNDQLRAMLSDRPWSNYPSGFNYGASAWAFTIGGGASVLSNNAISEIWVVPISVFEGMQIEQIEVVRASSNSSNVGSCILYYGAEGGVYSTENVHASAADPSNWWRTGGTGTANRASVVHTPGVPIVIGTDFQAFLVFTGGTNATLREIYDYRISMAWGN